MRINVRKFTGQVFSLANVEPDMTIAELKKLIEEQTQLGVKNQRLTYNRHILSDYESVEDAGLREGCTISLSLNLTA